MCLYEPTTCNHATSEQEGAEQDSAVAESSVTHLFTDTCNRMEADLEWLTAEPRAESVMLLRYFSDQVRRIKDLLEYRDILAECIAALACEGRVVLMNFDLDYTSAEQFWEYCA